MKHRFPILAKVIILGIGVSILTAGAAITVSYINQGNRSESTYINNIDNTLDEIEYLYSGSKDSSSYIDDLKEVKNYIEPIYNSDTDKRKLEDFESFTEFESFYAKKYPWIYSAGIIGLSQEMAAFKNAYYRVVNVLTSGQLSSGTVSAFFAFKDTDGNLAMMADSRFGRENPNGEFYQVSGTTYVVKETDYFIDKQYTRHRGLSLDNYRTRFIDILEDPNSVGAATLATLYIEYDLTGVHQESLNILNIELLVLGISSLTLVGLYALFAYLLFVKNINKLSHASSEIKQKLIDKNVEELVDINIKSNDEMRLLADSFTEMEKAIINYVNIIHQEAVERERTNAELNVASKIQLDSLPSNKLEDGNVSLRAFIKTAKEVGGDFYDYFYLDDNRLVVLVSDVSGKGIPASLFMMKGKELIKSALSSYKSLVEAINSVNNMLVRNNKELLFITSFIGVIDFNKNEIRYVNAGHEKPYIVSSKGVYKLDGESNIMLGVEPNFSFKEESHSFNKGDYLFMFTDGLNESINDKNEEFGYQRIEETINNTQGLLLDDVVNKINKEFEAFTSGEEQFDDVTMLLVKYRDNELRLHYETKDYEIITEITDRFNDSFIFLSEEVKSSMGIIIDELINNLISYEAREDLIIDVEFKINKKDLITVISSNGGDYDPFLNHEDKYLTEDTVDPGIGGFGIKIVKDFVDSYKYEYKNNKSIVTLTKKVL